MKKILIPVMLIAILVAFYQQGKDQPDIYITVICVVVFMMGMMWLSSKVPSKHKDETDDES